MPSLNSLHISPSTLKLISQIDEFKGAWRALGVLAPERLSALRKVATIESIGSSTRIEGSKLSDAEVEVLLANLSTQSFISRDEQEVAGYAYAMNLVFESCQDIRLSENHIKQLHKELLQYSDKDHWHRGQYKTASNSVAAFDSEGVQLGIVFQTSSPFETPLQMADLIASTQAELETKRLHPLLVIAVFVVTFLAIHPFQDGNGRLSRVLTTLLLLQAGYAYVPYSSMEAVIEQNKEAYYLALRLTQSTLSQQSPNWEPWVHFFLLSAQRQTLRLANRIESEHKLLANLPELSLQIIGYLRSANTASLAQIAIQTGANRNTIKLHLRKLVAARLLYQAGAGRGSYYQIAKP